jgi:hypothetical protein
MDYDWNGGGRRRRTVLIVIGILTILAIGGLVSLPLAGMV